MHFLDISFWKPCPNFDLQEQVNELLTPSEHSTKLDEICNELVKICVNKAWKRDSPLWEIHVVNISHSLDDRSRQWEWKQQFTDIFCSPFTWGRLFHIKLGKEWVIWTSSSRIWDCCGLQSKEIYSIYTIALVVYKFFVQSSVGIFDDFTIFLLIEYSTCIPNTVK